MTTDFYGAISVFICVHPWLSNWRDGSRQSRTSLFVKQQIAFGQVGLLSARVLPRINTDDHGFLWRDIRVHLCSSVVKKLGGTGRVSRVPKLCTLTPENESFLRYADKHGFLWRDIRVHLCSSVVKKLQGRGSHVKFFSNVRGQRRCRAKQKPPDPNCRQIHSGATRVLAVHVVESPEIKSTHSPALRLIRPAISKTVCWNCCLVESLARRC